MKTLLNRIHARIISRPKAVAKRCPRHSRWRTENWPQATAPC